ncbi:LysM peptidoglycan-binding domain-containing protein [Paenibacillus silvestris]|uniref:LysM peptidoglycan-binding domain-containing protein n=1 Tax=Paenibacillus silvestris TaxID=2606219 RepID=UPI00192885A2|nr:LysM peptidoglycan-binding domain-containing protein [Paenibacillus silvestris]
MQHYFYRQCPAGHYLHTLQPGDTLYHLAQINHISVTLILHANPGIDPYNLRVGQQLCIPSNTSPSNNTYMETIQAMQNDIDMLKAESQAQQTHESNFAASQKTTRVVKVTAQELQFDAVPVTFPGNYTGHYTMGSSYPYYLDAAMGGKRGITAKDNFGVWHTFVYQETTP